ncbi:MAG TPA: hypothetical protein VHE34_06350 [Puia sp.]|uniref:hypothetical protein n=1 Tax=Puia sp. TaxID=2045100 RepID=UPI002BB95161|nr:hypothetical protein [Puia sp.]HVU94825.1 hypothetical protein [Puia sp.]
MPKVICFLMVLLPLLLWGQTERIVVQSDKEVAYPGDTVWFSVNVLSYMRRASSNVHVQLYSEKGRKIQDHLFRCIAGIAPGQIRVPDSTGHYWMRFYTLGSPHCTLPLTVRGRGPAYTVVHPPDDTAIMTLWGGLMSMGRDTGGYFVEKVRPEVQYYSLAVSDTSQPFHFRHAEEQEALGYRCDTNLLSYQWKVQSTKDLTGRQLAAIVEQGHQRAMLLLPVDSTHTVRLDSLNFVDSTVYITYQLNHGEKEEVRLCPLEDDRPFAVPTGCLTDSIKQAYINIAGMKGIKAMDTAYVRVAWQRRNDGIHNRIFIENPYLKKFKGMFVSGYDFDKEPPWKWDQTIGDYLTTHRMHTMGGIHWVIDDREATPREVWHLDLKTIRYIDFEDGFMDGKEGYFAYGIIILRHGEDARNLPGHMNYVRPRGYTRMVRWTTADRGTILWVPFTTAQKTYLAQAIPFKVTLLVFANGHPMVIETTIDR